MIWIVPCNPEKYDIFSAIAHSSIIYWRQRVSFEAGDTVYIYLSKGVSAIKYKGIVVQTGIDSSIIDDPFWRDPKDNNVSKKAEIRIVKVFNTEMLSYKELKRHGLRSTIQGPMKLNDKIADYIQFVENQEM